MTATKDRLVASTRLYITVREECPHWDFDDTPDGDHRCCRVLLEAKADHKAALEAYAKESP